MAYKFKHLLAKSFPDNRGKHGAALYTGHIGAVMRSANILVEKLGASILQQLGLTSVSLETFEATVKLGAYLHDWGKANEHFQVMVRLNDPRASHNEKIRKQKPALTKFWMDIHQRQMLRHEIISGILALEVPAFRAWLELCPKADFHVAVWAAMGHHLKIGGRNGKRTDRVAELADGTGTSLTIYTRHAHFTALLQMGVRYLDLPAVLPECPQELWSSNNLEKAIGTLEEEFADFAEGGDDEYRRFTAAVKATVLTADIAGSALPNTKYRLEEWIPDVLQQVLSAAEIQSLINARLRENPLRPFQEQIAQTTRRVTLVKAGCGTGKTVAAYAWAKKFAVGRKLFFGYPTTGTASQGYTDYAAETSIETSLMHSRAAIDLQGVLLSNEAKLEQNPNDSEDAERVDARLSAFAAWQAKLIVCTVDTVLGLIQNNRKPLYSWPALCQSAFVFDEVHAYDERLFGALLRFLKTFRGAPILLMSASFTEGQLKAIHQTIEQLGETMAEIPGPQNLEILPRYSLQTIPSASDAWQEVKATLQQQRKVLWVTNTVSDCISIYESAVTELAPLGVIPLIYHSRYRYQDRVDKHKAVIEGFKSTKAIFAVTTQVCEMSLDLSADLLVSAMAPASALIQRLGRLNRKVVEDDAGQVHLVSGCVCSALIYPWVEKYPYPQGELFTGPELLRQLPDGAISQEHLSEVASRLGSDTPGNIDSNWLDGDWRSFPASLRETGHTLTVLLEEDMSKIRQAARQYKHSFAVEAQRWTVPILLPKSYAQWPREGIHLIAPSSQVTYCPNVGATVCK